MKRTLAAFLMIWILAVSVCGAALSVGAETSGSDAGRAEAASAAQTSETVPLAEEETSLELFLPESYEQYLELENPSDFAINDDYIAIADRQNNTTAVVYIYDRSKQTYQVIPNAGQSLTSLNFYKNSDGVTYLYYVGNDNSVYRVDLSAQTYQQELIEGFSCYSMIFLGDTVFSSRTQQNATIYRSNIDSIAETEQISDQSQFQGCTNPVFAVYGNSVYLAANTRVYIYNGEDFVAQGPITENDINSFAVYSADSSFSFYYTTSGNTLYRVVGEEQGRFNEEVNTYSKALYFDGDTYLMNLQNCSIRRLENSEAFGNYEIGKYSDSENRLGQEANDISIYGDKILIADTANNRIVITDQDGNSYSSVEIGSPAFVCAGENEFIVSDSHNLYVYTYQGEQVAIFTATPSGTLTGCAYSYGKYYLVGTGTNASGVLSSSSDGNYTFTESQITLSPGSVTADIFGNIYVLNGNSVYQYTEDTFISGAGNGIQFTAPQGTLKILADYEGNIYAVTVSGLYRLSSINYSSLVTSQNIAELIYGEDAPAIFSFAFGYENSSVYILSDGFVAKADLGVNAPASLNNIAASELYDDLHGAPAGEGEAETMLVTVPAGSVILPVSASSISESTSIFPYTSYSRTGEARTGVRVCELAAGTVVAFYRYAPSEESGIPPTREYTLALVLNDSRSTDDESDDIQNAGGYSKLTHYTGYTTNTVGLYRFPLMQAGGETIYSNGFTERLAKSTRVTVLGTISSPANEETPGYGLDFDYYFVALNIGGEVVYGFIPTNYIIDFNSSESWEGEEFSFRNVARGETITLYNGDDSLSLSNEEQVKVYGEPDANNEVYVTYTDETGTVWSGRVNADLLYEAGPSSLIVLAVVAVVVAAVLVSTCYLILRKQPTLQ